MYRPILFKSDTHKALWVFSVSFQMCFMPQSDILDCEVVVEGSSFFIDWSFEINLWTSWNHQHIPVWKVWPTFMWRKKRTHLWTVYLSSTLSESLPCYFTIDFHCESTSSKSGKETWNWNQIKHRLQSSIGGESSEMTFEWTLCFSPDPICDSDVAYFDNITQQANFALVT